MCKTVFFFFIIIYPIACFSTVHFLYLLAKDFPNISSFKAHFNCTIKST